MTPHERLYLRVAMVCGTPLAYLAYLMLAFHYPAIPLFGIRSMTTYDIAGSVALAALAYIAACMLSREPPKDRPEIPDTGHADGA